MNITAIFTLEQIMKVLPIIQNDQHILSIFAGRIFDTGLNAFEIMKATECDFSKKLYGNGNAGKIIVDSMVAYFA